jgi:hypothetical protein
MFVSVTLMKVAFGRARIALQINKDGQNTFLFHKFLFTKEHQDRAAAAVAKMEALLASSPEPLAVITPALWQKEGDESFKTQVFKPKTA